MVRILIIYLPMKYRDFSVIYYNSQCDDIIHLSVPSKLFHNVRTAFSSPEQCSQRATCIVLGVVGSVGIVVHKCLSFQLKLLRPHYFPTLSLI